MKSIKKVTLLMLLAAGLTADVCAAPKRNLSLVPRIEEKKREEQIDTTTNNAAGNGLEHSALEEDVAGEQIITLNMKDVKRLKEYYDSASDDEKNRIDQMKFGIKVVSMDDLIRYPFVAKATKVETIYCPGFKHETIPLDRIFSFLRNNPEIKSINLNFFKRDPVSV